MTRSCAAQVLHQLALKSRNTVSPRRPAARPASRGGNRGQASGVNSQGMASVTIVDDVRGNEISAVHGVSFMGGKKG